MACTAGADVFAQTGPAYPQRPVRLIVPLSAGGGMDTIARGIAIRLGEVLGQTVVVDNRAGGGGSIGVELVVRSAPDGHALLMMSASQLTYTLLYKANYDPARDFAPVTQVTTQPFVLIVHPTLPVASVREFVAYARANPGKLNYASSGNGGLIHLSVELFRAAAGIDMVHVPYKGMGAAYTDLISGQVQTALPSIITALPHVKTGRLRALGVSSRARARILPEVPTLSEGGVAGFEVAQWYGIVAPAGTPRPVVERLQRETSVLLAQPDVAARIAAEGSEPVGSTAQAFANHLGSELVRWGGVIRRTGIKGS
jgi:tripartite-type tricarboxylate transporter receptor subunit TctC